LLLKFEKPDWSANPEFCVIDTILESRPDIILMLKSDIANIVFNKVTGSMQNIVINSNMETRLKRWRSTMEAIISNLNRGFNIFTCNWKGWIHFQAKVLWSILAYNFRVITGLILTRIRSAPKVCCSS